MLIHPPVAKPSEPPPGIAALAGAWGPGLPVIDANLEGLRFLLDAHTPDGKPQADRVWRRRSDHWEALKRPEGYTTVDHYNRIVGDLERVLSATGNRIKVGLADYGDTTASPLRSRDLLREAAHPERNPFYPYYRDVLLPRIEREAPEWIGLSVNFLSQALPAFALLGMIQRRWPNLPLALGGGLVTSWMALEAWDDPFAGLVDRCFAGPAEAGLTAWRDKPMAEAHPPNYDLLPLDGYLSPRPVLPYAASRGCLWRRCRFCPEVAEQSAYRPLPVDRARQELDSLIGRHRPGLVHLLDSAISPRLLDSLVQSPLGVSWYGYLRFDAALEDLEACQRLKASGCVMAKLGLESGSQAVLDAMDKGINVDRAGRILENLRKAGIATFVYVLFGTPTEGEAEARQTLDFVREHAEAITFLNSALFLLPRHSPLAAELSTSNFSGDDLSLYAAFDHPKGWDRRAVRHFIDRVWRRDPAVAAILRRTPKVFTSNHAPFFTEGMQSVLSGR